LKPRDERNAGMSGTTRHGALAALLLMVLIATGCPMGPAPGGPNPGTTGPALFVTPLALDLGTESTGESFTIRNAGGGTLEWSLTISQPWLTANVMTGTTTTETDRVLLTADRSGFTTPGIRNAVITLTSNGGTQTVFVSLRIAGTPSLEISPTALSFSASQRMNSFTITNTGDDSLQFNLDVLDPDDPGTIVDVSQVLDIAPVTGSIPPGGNVSVTVSLLEGVDTIQIGEEIVSDLSLRVNTNAGAGFVTLTFLAAEELGEIGVEPGFLEFDETANVQEFEVVNNGAAGTTLNFELTTDREDLILFDPTSGTSIGAVTGVGTVEQRDPVTITVTINRQALQSDQDGGTIFVSSPGLDTVEVPVTVDRAPLTLQGAENRTRPPFLLRFVFTIRDQFGETIDVLDPNVLAELQDAFEIEEDGEPLDLDETSFFVTSGLNLKHNVVILLDFTGSMFNAGNGNGEVIDQMVEGAKELIRDLPPSFRIAILEYHQRQQATRLISNFSTDKDALIEQLDSFSLLPGENGASEVFDAVEESAQRLANEDINVLSFDGADVRSVVFITDGRDTSSVSDADSATNFAEDLRVRLYPIAFGEDPAIAPLVSMADETGGQFYRAQNAAELLNLLANESDEGPDAPGLIAKDLSRQVVLSYVGLQAMGGTYRITATVNGNTGQFERDAVVAAGDLRAGQIQLFTTGLEADGTARVFVRGEYFPRAVSQIRFRLFTDETVDVSIDPNGPISDWVLIDQGNDTYLALTNEATPAPFGAFGNLFRLDFSGVAEDMINVGFRVDNRLYLSPPTARFFQYPFNIMIDSTSNLAAVVPLPPDSGFNPDAPFAFDTDEDGIDNFEDRNPENDLLP